MFQKLPERKGGVGQIVVAALGEGQEVKCFRLPLALWIFGHEGPGRLFGVFGVAHQQQRLAAIEHGGFGRKAVGKFGNHLVECGDGFLIVLQRQPAISQGEQRLVALGEFALIGQKLVELFGGFFKVIEAIETNGQRIFGAFAFAMRWIVAQEFGVLLGRQAIKLPLKQAVGGDQFFSARISAGGLGEGDADQK